MADLGRRGRDSVSPRCGNKKVAVVTFFHVNVLFFCLVLLFVVVVFLLLFSFQCFLFNVTHREREGGSMVKKPLFLESVPLLGNQRGL